MEVSVALLGWSMLGAPASAEALNAGMAPLADLDPTTAGMAAAALVGALKLTRSATRRG